MGEIKLHIVYHCFCVNNWKSIVEEQFQYLRGRKIDCTLIGAEEDENLIQQIAKKSNIQLTCIRFKSPEVFEHEAMILACEISKRHPSDYLLYFHTKGSSVNDKLRVNWRNYMNELLIEQLDFHFEQLKSSSCNVTGMLYTKIWMDRDLKWKSTGFFAGNFWIASCHYITSLPDYTTLRKKHNNNRYLAERYLAWNNPDIRFIDQVKAYGKSWFSNHISKRLNRLE